ncbi:MAG: tetratricopeptide repeat protein [Saprospiraceae bacterium]
MAKVKPAIIFLIFLTIICQIGVGQSSLLLTPALQEAYKDFTSLKIQSGKSKISLIRLKDPHNAMVDYIENYGDFFTLFIQENKSQYKELKNNKDIRLRKIQASDSSSPYYLYCQAEIILQWAIIKLKFGDKINAARDVYEAYKLLERNKERFPDFIENNKSLSIIHALAESVPGWVRKIIGLKGSVALGTKEIKLLAERAATENTLFKDEIIAIYSYILFYSNNQKEEAYALYDRYGLDHRTNPLIAFLKATMAQKNGNNSIALRILEERPKGSEYLPFYYLDFMYGKFKLYRLDKDADIHITKFLNKFNGQHYIKEAWQKMAWYSLVIDNDLTAYQQAISNCKSNGQALIDEDIQALKEAKATTMPNQLLLKSRLLYDGGYYAKCQNLLILNSDKFIKAIHDGEYYYRLARVTDALKNYTDALEFYDLTIIKSDPGKYYACSAALHAGLIYESSRKYELARQYFEKCLSLDPAGYSSSLHQKAKSGLSRIQ